MDFRTHGCSTPRPQLHARIPSLENRRGRCRPIEAARHDIVSLLGVGGGEQEARRNYRRNAADTDEAMHLSALRSWETSAARSAAEVQNFSSRRLSWSSSRFRLRSSS